MFRIETPSLLPRTKRVLVAALVALFTVACAGQAIQTERMLAAAGFQMRMADTPEKLARLAKLTQRELMPKMKDGSLRYVYADAEYCKCLYVGTEKAYQGYSRYALKQSQVNANLAAAQMNEDASLNWGMWGPWGPWY